MPKPSEKKTLRKAVGATQAQARRASGKTAAATAAANEVRDLVAVAVRRCGADNALSRTMKHIQLSDTDTLDVLFRLAVLDYLFLTTRCRDIETFYEHLAAGRGTPLTDVEMRQLAEQVRQYHTGKNRALQTALSVQKQHADQHLADIPQAVHFTFDAPEPEEPEPDKQSPQVVH